MIHNSFIEVIALSAYDDLNDCLESLDNLQIPEGMPLEDFEEWNAVFEDALFLMETGDDEDAEASLSEIRELADNYRRYADRLPELRKIVERLETALGNAQR